MIVYFVYSRSYGHILKKENVSILFSYAARRKEIFPTLPKGFPGYFVDCGAFSVGEKTIGSIDVETYGLWLQFLLRNNYNNIVYCNLDVIGDPDKTLANQIYLESLGLKPLPVWHEGEDEWFLNYYCQNYEYVAIGGMVSAGFSKLHVFKLTQWLLQTYTQTKFHLFGVGISAATAFRTFRPYSVDFSTWTVGARFGHTISEDSKQGIKQVVPDDEYRNLLRQRPYLEEQLGKDIQTIKKFFSTIDDLHDPHQGLLL